MPALIREYAARLGINVTSAVGANRHEIGYKLTDKKGRALGSIQLGRTGSSAAFSGLLSGEADIGMSSRRIRQTEVAQLAAAGMPRMQAAGSEHVIALDGLMILVAAENPAVSISITNIAKIFAGQVTDWSAGRAAAWKNRLVCGNQRFRYVGAVQRTHHEAPRPQVFS